MELDIALSYIDVILDSLKELRRIRDSWFVDGRQALPRYVRILRYAQAQHLIINSALFDKESFGVSKGRLDKLKKLRSFTERLTSSFEEETRSFNRDLEEFTNDLMPAVLHHGIGGLPDEILAMSLSTDAHSMSTYAELLERSGELQLTCRRFYSVIRSYPNCRSWNHISNSFFGSPDKQREDPNSEEHHRLKLTQLERQLRVHSVAPLDLCIHAKDQYLLSYLKRLVWPHTDRIRALEWNGCYGMPPGALTAARDDYREFPSVQTLIIRSDNFFPPWTFPQLTSLECHLIPPPGSFPLLNRCVFNYINCSVASPCCDATARFLVTTPRLQYLEFSRASWSGGCKGINTDILLPDLKALIFGSTHSSLCTRIIQSLEHPVLECLEIRDWFICLSRGQVYPSVKTLELTLEDLYTEVVLDQVHRIFPSLQRLAIRTYVGLPVWEETEAVTCIALRSLTIDLASRVDRAIATLGRLTHCCKEDWDLETLGIIRDYKRSGAELHYVEVRGYRCGKTDRVMNPTSMREAISTLFPKATVRLPEWHLRGYAEYEQVLNHSEVPSSEDEESEYSEEVDDEEAHTESEEADEGHASEASFSESSD